MNGKAAPLVIHTELTEKHPVVIFSPTLLVVVAVLEMFRPRRVVIPVVPLISRAEIVLVLNPSTVVVAR